MRVVMRHARTTASFLGPRGEPVPGSIAEVKYLRLGGIDQWVMMRGEHQENPAIILLHGGPGFSETHFFRRFNSPLESSFTVVYWDQRGAGKSFNRHIPKSSMTVEQFLGDLDELVDAVCERLGQDKVAIFGHSWGTVLGLLYAARFPDKVSVYVGCEQVGDWAAAEAASYQFAMTEARHRQNLKALKDLRAIGPPPYSAKSVLRERTWLQRFSGELSLGGWWNMSRLFLGCPEWSLLDLVSVARGFLFTLDAMWTEVSTLNLFTLAPELKVPTFFFVGRHDHWVPAETSVAYFDALAAPAKQLVWFKDSGHEPFVDEPAKFNRTMIELVRPAADLMAGGRLRAAG
jgi:pimeloyl-ACP methyl ester carboxylesterase